MGPGIRVDTATTTERDILAAGIPQQSEDSEEPVPA
jgi:hypothetical protein